MHIYNSWTNYKVSFEVKIFTLWHDAIHPFCGIICFFQLSSNVHHDLDYYFQDTQKYFWFFIFTFLFHERLLWDWNQYFFCAKYIAYNQKVCCNTRPSSKPPKVRTTWSLVVAVMSAINKIFWLVGLLLSLPQTHTSPCSSVIFVWIFVWWLSFYARCY